MALEDENRSKSISWSNVHLISYFRHFSCKKMIFSGMFYKSMIRKIRNDKLVHNLRPSFDKWQEKWRLNDGGGGCLRWRHRAEINSRWTEENKRTVFSLKLSFAGGLIIRELLAATRPTMLL